MQVSRLDRPSFAVADAICRLDSPFMKTMWNDGLRTRLEPCLFGNSVQAPTIDERMSGMAQRSDRSPVGPSRV